MANNYGTFVGKLKKPTGDKVKFVAPAKNNENVLLLNATMESDTNRVFVKMVGFKNDKIRVSLGDGEKMEVDWKNRFDEDIVKKAPSWAKTRIKIGDEDKEFLTTWDAINYINDNYDKIENEKLTVSIKWDKNPYNGVAGDQFSIQKIFSAKEDAKDRLGIKTVFWWNKDSIDEADWDSEKILRVNGYIKSYDKEEKKDIFFPQTIVLNCSKVDFENEHQKQLVDYRLKNLKTKSSTFQECKMECVFISGAEKKDDSEWDESMLTEAQKEQVALGLKTVADFNPGGVTYGDFKTELRFVNFDLTGDYTDGIVDSGVSQTELEEELWYGAKDYSDDDGFEPVPEALDKELEDLFV